MEAPFYFFASRLEGGLSGWVDVDDRPLQFGEVGERVRGLVALGMSLSERRWSGIQRCLCVRADFGLVVDGLDHLKARTGSHRFEHDEFTARLEYTHNFGEGVAHLFYRHMVQRIGEHHHVDRSILDGKVLTDALQVGLDMFGVSVSGSGDHGLARLHTDRASSLVAQEPHQSASAATNINNSLATQLYSASKPVIVRRQIPQCWTIHPRLLQ